VTGGYGTFVLTMLELVALLVTMAYARGR